MADPGDPTPRRLDVLAREHGVVCAFRLPCDDDEELEGCFLRLGRDDTEAHGLMMVEIESLDGSWTDQFLVGTKHLAAALGRAGLIQALRTDSG